MKVALVYDRVNKWGGAERVLLALKKIFPQAPLYTAVYHPQSAPWAKEFPVIPSFLQKFPFAKTHHELYPWLTPLAFESFNFDQYELVISVTSAEAKGIITKPPTRHLCYCLTPTRYLYSARQDYFKNPGFGSLNPVARLGFQLLFPYLEKWDQLAAHRPDFYMAISQNVQKRIKKYYQRDSQVIYPPVDLEKFKARPPALKTRDYFLLVSRLVPYKKIDLVIQAFNELGLPLKIIGLGSQENHLKNLAGPKIEFLGYLTERKLLSYYYSCRAVVCPQEEDFGLVPLEAQACGKPVLSFRGGGALETVIEGQTGEFFSPQKPAALIKLIKKFNPKKYSPQACRQNAARFSQKIFINRFKKETEKLWKQPATKN